MGVYVVFGVGIGNLGQHHRRPMTGWIAQLNRSLDQRSPTVEIIDSFGHTGNFLASSSSADLKEVIASLDGELATNWVVRPLNSVLTAVTAVSNECKPEASDGIRWTPGLAFQVGAGIECKGVVTTPRAILWQISPGTIGVWKRDILGKGNMLDRNRRGGGWGKISGDIEAQLGGRWTARSLRTVDGLLSKAKFKHLRNTGASQDKGLLAESVG